MAPEEKLQLHTPWKHMLMSTRMEINAKVDKELIQLFLSADITCFQLMIASCSTTDCSTWATLSLGINDPRGQSSKHDVCIISAVKVG